VLDGCRKISYPPHCPSWRLTRETFYGYPGCGTCQGTGVQGRGRSVGGSSYPEYCRDCSERMSSHPVRKGCWDSTEQLMRDWQERFDQALNQMLGLPRRVSRKRRADAIEAMDQQVLAGLKGQYLAAYQQDRTEYTEHSRWADQWRAPTPEEQI